MTRGRPLDGAQETRVPFWRNVKVIGVLAQLLFALLVVAGVMVLVHNVTTALSAANLPADFSFLTKPAGIPVAERPIPYEGTDSYARALFIGFLNTLKVAVLGVVLATILGVLFGVMRLSGNWLIRTVAGIYIEVLRNVPVAVQIVVWYAAILLPFPPRISDPLSLPGGFFLSNVGVAFPAIYPTYRFNEWLPWLIAGALLALIVGVWRARRLKAAGEEGRVWPYWLAAFVVAAGIGLALAQFNKQTSEEIRFTFQADRGRGTTTMLKDGEEKVAAFVPVRVSIAAAQLKTTSQNLVESRKVVNGTFRFPLLQESDAASFEVDFADPAAAGEQALELHFSKFPSVGTIYVDLNGNGEMDEGEDVNPATGRGYGGVEVVMNITEFERVLVSDRDGRVRLPAFSVPSAEGSAAAETAAPTPASRFSAFGPPAVAAAEEEELEAESEILPVGALVLSRAHIPVSNYEGGMRLTVNYLALLLALVIYTSAFIAEIVRGGILAVPKGQREAAMAVGLSGYDTFTRIIFPQAMRVVLPPMISQYLNLTKNSSLAQLAGYAELFVIASVVSNQTGAAIPIALLLIGAYLLISFAFSLVLNQVNARLAIVER